MELSFDDIQLALDQSDKDWYSEAADEAASESWVPAYCRPAGMTVAQFYARRRELRGGRDYKFGQGPNHPWKKKGLLVSTRDTSVPLNPDSERSGRRGKF